MATIESHIIDRKLQSDFYGMKMQICLAVYLRPEIKFSSFQALIDQIHADIEDGRYIMRCAEEEEKEDEVNVLYKKLKTKVFERMEGFPLQGDDVAELIDT